MTREEFARRWLSPGISPPRGGPISVANGPSKTEAAPRTFTEKPPAPSRLMRTRGFVRQWAMAATGASLLFVSMALVVVKLAPYVANYASTYLAE